MKIDGLDPKSLVDPWGTLVCLASTSPRLEKNSALGFVDVHQDQRSTIQIFDVSGDIQFFALLGRSKSFSPLRSRFFALLGHLI